MRNSGTQTHEFVVEAIVALRRLRFTGEEIAELFGLALSTVSGILKRIGMGKLGRLGMEPEHRYKWERPGELVHVDIKKLGRIERGAGKRITGGGNHYTGSFTDAAGRRRRKAGWEYVHIAIDDCSRLAYAEVLADERAMTAIGFLKRAVEFFNRHGVAVERVLTDNGSAYISTIHAIACRTLAIRHLRTRPRRPQTNGKAERFIRTCSAAGPTAQSTPRAKNAPQPLTAGSGATTINADIAPSADEPRSLASTSGTTCSRPTASRAWRREPVVSARIRRGATDECGLQWRQS